MHPPSASRRSSGSPLEARSRASATSAARACWSASSSFPMRDQGAFRRPRTSASGCGRPAVARGLLLRASHWMPVLAPPLTITETELDSCWTSSRRRSPTCSLRRRSAARLMVERDGTSARQIVGDDGPIRVDADGVLLDRGARRAGARRAVRHTALRHLRGADPGERPAAARRLRGALAARDAPLCDQGEHQPRSPADPRRRGRRRRLLRPRRADGVAAGRRSRRSGSS